MPNFHNNAVHKNWSDKNMKKIILISIIFFLTLIPLDVRAVENWCDNFNRTGCQPWTEVYATCGPNIATWDQLWDIIIGSPPNCQVLRPDELSVVDGLSISRDIESTQNFQFSTNIKTSFIGVYSVCPCYWGCPPGCYYLSNCSEAYKGYIGLEFYSNTTKILSIRFGTMFPENQTYTTNEFRIYCSGNLMASQIVNVEIFANWNSFSAKRIGSQIEAKAGSYTLTANCPSATQPITRVVISSASKEPYPASRAMYADDVCLSPPVIPRCELEVCNSRALPRTIYNYFLTGLCLSANLFMCNRPLIIITVFGLFFMYIIYIFTGKGKT
jgi:hypothetical protein